MMVLLIRLSFLLVVLKLVCFMCRLVMMLSWLKVMLFMMYVVRIFLVSEKFLYLLFLNV